MTINTTLAGNKEELFAIVSALEAMGYEIYKGPRGWTDRGFMQVVIREGYRVSGNYSYADGRGRYLAPETFLLEAAKMKFKYKFAQIKLNDQHTAEITEDKVRVGCQEFDADIVLSLADKIKELRQ